MISEHREAEKSKNSKNSEYSDAPNLDQEEVREILMAHDGNVTAAAKELDVDPERLRTYVYAIPALKRAIEETLAQGVDAAVDVLFTALRDQASFQNRYYAAKEFLRSDAGRRRGFGPREHAALEVKPLTPATLTLKWLDSQEGEGP
jgi:hypothetical protein